MQRLLVVVVSIVSASLVLVADARAVDDTSWAENYRDQLRRELVDRARARRDSGTSQTQRNQTGNGGTNTTGLDLQNPFGTGVDFGAGASDWAANGNVSVFSGGSSNTGNAKRGQANTNQALDLNGRPLSAIRATPAQQPARTQPPKQVAADAAGQDGTGAAGASSRAVQAAELLYNNGECGAARRVLLPLASSLRGNPDEVDTAKKFIERIDTEGMKRLTEGDEAGANGEVERAALIYDEIVRKYGAAPAAGLAKGKLMVLREDPEVAARFLYERALSYVEKKRLDIAVPMLREIVKRYGKTAYAANAAAELAKLEKLLGEGELTQEQAMAARKWLIIGDIHAANGRAEQAVESYRRVIQDFEDSTYAEWAREKIASLSKAE